MYIYLKIYKKMDIFVIFQNIMDIPVIYEIVEIIIIIILD